MSLTVAVLGTGLMGAPIARNLARAGFRTSAWNRSIGRAAPLTKDGVHVATSAAACVADADVVISMLINGPICDAVLFGEEAAAKAIRPGATVVMMSSIAPEVARSHAERLGQGRVAYLDAPVSGGERGAIEATLTIFAGGHRDDIERVRPVLAALGRVNPVGGVGSGQLVKLANQMIVGVTIAAVAEALLLIERGGGDARAAFAALEGGFADSAVLRQHGARMLATDHVPGATVATQLKDLRTAAELAGQLDLSLPLLDGVRNLFEAAAAGPDALLDHSAVHRTLRAAQLRTDHKG